MMKMSDRGLVMLMASEGIVPGPYLDSEKVWTYGIGHTAEAGDFDPADLPRGVPDDLDSALMKVMAVFRKDIAKYEAAVNKAIKVEMQQHEFDALTHFHFNTGAIGVAKLTQEFNAGNKEVAGKRFMSYSKPKSIVERRRKEQLLFLTGQYDKDTVPVWGVGKEGNVIWKRLKSLTAEQALNLLKLSEGIKVEFNDTTEPRKVEKPDVPELKPAVSEPQVDPEFPILKFGSTGEKVLIVQKFLANYGYPVGRSDGIFGSATMTAVKLLQKQFRLEQDGIVGPKTWKIIKGR